MTTIKQINKWPKWSINNREISGSVKVYEKKNSVLPVIKRDNLKQYCETIFSCIRLEIIKQYDTTPTWPG